MRLAGKRQPMQSVRQLIGKVAALPCFYREEQKKETNRET
jgi:hypothetical protein